MSRQPIPALVLTLLLTTSLLVLTTHATPSANIVVTTTQDLVANDGLCSLREAVTAANTDAAFNGCPAGSGVDTITLSEGTYILSITGQDDQNVSGDLDIRSSLKIVGMGKEKTIIQGAPDFFDQLIDVRGPVQSEKIEVMVENVTLREGRGIGGGMLIYLNGVVTLSNTSVMSNYTSGVWNQGGKLTILQSDIMSNTGATLGGGVRSSGMLTVENSQIAYNIADNGGGVGGGGTSHLNNVTVMHNRTDGSGGGLSVKGTILNSRIENNIGRSGGGIAATGGLTLKGSQINGNRAMSDSNGGGTGGALITLFSNIEIEESDFRNNRADQDGGAIYSVASTMRITGGDFEKNEAKRAGAIANGGTLSMTNSQIIDNRAERGAGIGNSANLFIEGGRIANNIATGIGGGLATDGGKEITDPFIKPFLPEQGRSTLKGVLIENNQASRGAGIGTAGETILENVTLRNNIAGERGGGIAVGSGRLQITGGFVRDNTAGQGAGIHFTYESQYGNQQSNGGLTNVTIRSNRATTAGGGLLVASQTISVTDSALLLNQAPTGAGLLVESSGEGDAGTAILEDTDLANSGTNCTTSGGTIISKGDNASSDKSCENVFRNPGDRNEAQIPIPDEDRRLYLPQVRR